MSCRIRYSKNESGSLLTSNNTFILPDGKVVRAFIMTDPGFTASIQVVDSTSVLFSETYDNLRKAKNGVKAALMQLGVHFNSEVRKRLTNLSTDHINDMEPEYKVDPLTELTDDFMDHEHD